MDTKQKNDLVAKAHNLRPVVLIGQKGLTDAVLAEIDMALSTHELIKIKVNAELKEDRQEMLKKICTNLNAENLKLIGSIAIIYREAEQ